MTPPKPRRARSKAPAATSTPDTAVRANEQAGQPARILIVDDEEAILTLLSLALSAHGFSVQTASTVKEAIERCASESFDVVLSDVRLPDSTGHDLVRWLSLNCAPAIPILMTGFDDDCLSCPERRGCVFLSKPFRLTDAISIVEGALSRRLS